MIDIKRFLFISLMIYLLSCSKNGEIVNGYQDKVSYVPNDTVKVYLNGKSNCENCTIDLFKLGYGAVEKFSINLKKQKVTNKAYWWKNGYSYDQTFSFNSRGLISGVYFFDHSAPFVIKNNWEKNKILMVYPSNTVNAYNKLGGRSAYSKPPGNKLSFKRPSKIQEYINPFLQWLPKQPFEVDYISDIDLDDYTNISGYKLIIIAGHSEYWSRKGRRNFNTFINAGGNALILSGNTMWWQVRYINNQMIIYKNFNEDVITEDSLKTVKWIDERLNYPIEESIGLNYKHGGYGLKKDSGWDGYAIVNSSPLFNDAGVNIGDTLSIPTAEYDGCQLDFINNKPIIDTNYINFYKQELLGYDKTKGENKYGTWIVFKKALKSGTIINVGTTNWCSSGFLGKDGDKIKRITYNCIDHLINDKPVFRD